MKNIIILILCVSSFSCYLGPLKTKDYTASHYENYYVFSYDGTLLTFRRPEKAIAAASQNGDIKTSNHYIKYNDELKDLGRRGVEIDIVEIYYLHLTLMERYEEAVNDSRQVDFSDRAAVENALDEIQKSIGAHKAGLMDYVNTVRQNAVRGTI